MASLSNGALARVAASLVSCEGAAKDPTPAPVTAAPTIEWSRANLDELKQLLPMSLAKIRLSAGGLSRAPAVQQYSWYSSTAGTAVQLVQHTLVLDLCVRDVLDVYTAGTAETLMYLMYIQQVQQK